ncbi:serpentine type 7TM GPCR chemoreceptor srv domain-containing protein [Ditylenchus destructor]|uniref:Serpentine type 7TM GPCR chemoreceptor srv domain-containing protein n=1 Tax=Ditylenchus destructor TaxID=166010 RepID=A0AAD4MVD0_9BILA|nr:serpentine type 7TM GPCR chemoreceptor srv domain-containing protein [Ditylenchus destructor]
MSQYLNDWFIFVNVIAANPWPPFIFALVIGVPSMLLYFVEFGIVLFTRLLSYKQFNSAFFTLFLFRATVNLINYFVTYMYNRFGRVGILMNSYLKFSPLALAFWLFLNFYCYHCENLITCFILVNRLTSILFPNRQKLIWKYLLPISILLTLSLPIPFLIHAFLYHHLAYVWIDPRNNLSFTLSYKREPGIEYISDSYLCAASAVLFLIICGFLNISAIIAYKLKKRKYENVKRGARVSKSVYAIEEEKIQIRLHIYAFLTFLGQLLMCIFLIIIYQCSMIYDIKDPRSTIYLATFNQFSWISDISSIVIPAWLILWASTLLREIVMDLVYRTIGRPFNYVWRRVVGIEAISVSPGITTSFFQRVT